MIISVVSKASSQLVATPAHRLFAILEQVLSVEDGEIGRLRGS